MIKRFIKKVFGIKEKPCEHYYFEEKSFSYPTQVGWVVMDAKVCTSCGFLDPSTRTSKEVPYDLVSPPKYTMLNGKRLN